MKRAALGAAVCALAACGGQASAQMFNNLAGNMAINRLQLAPIASLGARNAAERAHTRRGTPAAGAHAQNAPRLATSTAYRADPATAERGRRQFAERIRAISGRDAGDQMARLLASRDLRQAWVRQAAPDGMRPGDVADAMTEYFVTNWQIAHGAANPKPAAFHAVRDEVRSALLRQPKFATLADPQKQALAEAFMYDTLLEGEAYVAAVKRGDQAGARSLQQASVARFRNEVGVDLRRMDLTDRGFTHGG